MMCSRMSLDELENTQNDNIKNTVASRIILYLSATKPSARNTITATIRWPMADFLMFCPPRASILIQRVEVGRDESSRHDRISVL